MKNVNDVLLDLNDMTPEQVESHVNAHNKKMRSKASGKMKNLIAQVDDAFAEANEDFFGDERFKKENELREWIRTLTGFPSANISDAEQLLSVMSDAAPYTVLTLSGYDEEGNKSKVLIIKTPLGTIGRLTEYIVSLERAIIQNEQFTKSGFFDLIKLAFKKLFSKEK